jgi:hypothetical protein
VTLRYIQLTTCEARHNLMATVACLATFVILPTVELRPCCFGYFAAAIGGQVAAARLPARTGTLARGVTGRGQRLVPVKPVPVESFRLAAIGRRRHQGPSAGRETA